MNKICDSNKVILEILEKEPGFSYPSFHIYVPTSDPSGDYRVRYCFRYEYDDRRDVFKANSTTNISNYRIKTAQLVKITGREGERVIAEEIAEVLQQGEISCAIKHKIDGVPAPDFIGGYHGDERIGAVALTADQKQIDLGSAAPALLFCGEVRFDQETTIYQCTTSTADSFGVPAVAHTQAFRIDASGVRNHQTATWLAEKTELVCAYLLMYTMRRVFKDKPVCDHVAIYDGNGALLGEADTPLNPEKTDAILHNTSSRRVAYRGDASGVSASVSFDIPDRSMAVADAHILVRTPQNDNKLYVNFASPIHGTSPVAGEVWTLDTHQKIDYIAPGSAK